MSANTRNRIRLAVDLANPFAPPINQHTSLSPEFPSARTCRVDVGVYDNGTFEANISQFSSLTFELMAASARTGARIVTKTVTSFNSATVDGWNSGTEQHATFELTAAEMNAFTFSSNEQDLWLVVTGTSADGNVTLIAGPAKAIEDGGVYAGASAPEAGDSTYLTADQVRAEIQAAFQAGRFVSKNGLYERIFGVSDDGRRVDRLRQIT